MICVCSIVIRMLPFEAQAAQPNRGVACQPSRWCPWYESGLCIHYVLMCNYVYIYIYIYIHTYIYIYIYIHTHIHTHTYMYIHTYTHVVMYNAYVYIHICIYIYTHMFVHVYMCIYIYIYIYTYTYLFIHRERCICVYLSLSLYIYIYTHMCMHTIHIIRGLSGPGPHAPERAASPSRRSSPPVGAPRAPSRRAHLGFTIV